jgi:ferric-dicitrate binding protein FerR (iron transport regulator)
MLFSGLIERFFKRGREEYSVEDKELWAEWNERRMAAKEAGEPFDEPSPAPGRRPGRRRRRKGASAASGAAAGAFLVGPPVDHHFGGHDGAGGHGGGGDVGGGF